MLSFIQNQVFPQFKPSPQQQQARSGTAGSLPLAPSLAKPALLGTTAVASPRSNPFLISTDALLTSKPQQAMHENKPFASPLFLGYYNNKALYGGSKLFILG